MDQASILDGVAVEVDAVPLLRDNVSLNGTARDMSGFGVIEFLLLLGSTDITCDLKAQQGDASDGSDAADIIGAAITQLGAGDDDKFARLIVVASKITSRYVRCVLVTGDGTAGVDCAVVSMRYPRSGRTPVTASSSQAERKLIAPS